MDVNGKIERLRDGMKLELNAVTDGLNNHKA